MPDDNAVEYIKHSHKSPYYLLKMTYLSGDILALEETRVRVGEVAEGRLYYITLPCSIHTLVNAALEIDPLPPLFLELEV